MLKVLKSYSMYQFSCSFMIIIIIMQNQSPSKLEQRLAELLAFYNQDNEHSLVQLMLNPSKAQSFLKTYDSIPENQHVKEAEFVNLAENYNYEEIFSYFSSFDQHAQKLIRKVIMYKYSKEDDEVIRTHSSRKKLWLLMSGAFGAIGEKKSMFETLSDFNNYQDYFGRIIEADVLRTIHEKDNKEEMRKRMSRILYSFARKNPYIGYCQGMNFIVSFLLTMQFSDEEVFWLLNCIMENFTPFNYYTNMMGVAVDLKIIESIIRIKEPKIYAKLKELGVDISIFMLEWLVCLFTSVLPFYLLVIVWDLFFMKGSVILIKTCLIMLEYMTSLIMEATEFSSFFMEFEKLKKKIFIEEWKFLKRVKELFIDDRVLVITRKLFELRLLVEREEMKIGVEQKLGWNQLQCNIEWPICFQQLRKQKTNEEDLQIWVFRDQNGPKIITDYLQVKNRKSVKIKQENNHESKLVIGRIPHICDVKSYKQRQQANNRQIELDEFDMGLRRFNKNLEGILHLSSTEFFRRATSNHSFFFVSPRKQ